MALRCVSPVKTQYQDGAWLTYEVGDVIKGPDDLTAFLKRCSPASFEEVAEDAPEPPADKAMSAAPADTAVKKPKSEAMTSANTTALVKGK